MSFDLTDRPWLPVVTGGGVQEVSLRDALVRAHEWEAVDMSRPVVGVALLRLLMAVALDADRDGVTGEEWSATWRRGRFDIQAVETYLATHGDRFDLFHTSSPFYQVAGLEAINGSTKPASLILPEVASGNSTPLFSVTLESDEPPLTPPEAARRLVAVITADTAAIKPGAAGDDNASAGKTTGNPVGPLGALGVVVPLGRTLFETLMLSMPERCPPGEDLPAWRRAPTTPSWEKNRRPSGVLDLLTWQSRRLRLIPAVSDNGPVVRRVVLTAGDRMDFTPDVEPHTLWRAVDPQESSIGVAYRPARHRPGREGWRGLDSLIALQREGRQAWTSTALQAIGRRQGRGALPLDYPLTAMTVGVIYGNQSAVVDDIISDSLPLPLGALLADDSELRDEIRNLVDSAEAVISALNTVHTNVREAAGAVAVPWDRGRRLGEDLVPILDRLMRAFLRTAQADGDQVGAAAIEWEAQALTAAWDVADRWLDSIDPALVIGRRHGGMSGSLARIFFRSALAKALPRAADHGPGQGDAANSRHTPPTTAPHEESAP